MVRKYESAGERKAGRQYDAGKREAELCFENEE